MATKRVSPAKKAKRHVKSFRPSKVADHTIVDTNGKVVGHIRVKPSGVLWSPRDGKVWHGLSLDQFAKYAIDVGRKQQK